MLLARLQGSHKTNPMNAPLKLGQSILRREDRRFLTGRGRYTDDTAPSNALAVLFVRSPHAHARLIGIDRNAALASPGVAAIYTADDLLADKLGHLPAISEIKDEAGNRHREPAHLAMPIGKVRHVGDIVAMIVAETLDRSAEELRLWVEMVTEAYDQRLDLDHGSIMPERAHTPAMASLWA